MLFSVWSILTGIQLEYVLLNVEEDLGRKVLALTAVIVLATALIGIYSHVDFGFLQIPLFIALCILLLFTLFNLFASMDGVKQRICLDLAWRFSRSICFLTLIRY